MKVSFWALVCLLWVLATGINMSKAFHVDDTFHLEAACWILENPSRPMSACINWGDDIQNMYCSSQPPLYFYFVAWIGHMFSFTEWPLHLMQSVFTFMALYFFAKSALILYPAHAAWLLILFATGPAFLVNQNLMVDMPVLGFFMLILYLCLKPEPKSRNYAWANISIGISFLIKYTSIAFAPAIALAVLYRKRYVQILWTAIPGFLFFLWSALNFYEYHRIHLINRESLPFDINVLGEKIRSFLMVLGSVSPFVIILIAALLPGKVKIQKAITFIACLLPLVFILMFYVGWIQEFQSSNFLLKVFIVNGILCMGISLYAGFRMVSWKGLRYRKIQEYSTWVLISLFICVSLFVTWMAPFMATRHILLVIPVLLLLAGSLLDRVPVSIIATGSLMNLALGLALALGDLQYANDYKNYAALMTKLYPDKERVWMLGHWGFQWYMKEEGYPVYETSFTRPNTGDIFIIPRNYSVQKVNEDIELSEPVFFILPNPDIINVRNFASLYASPYPILPWRLSTQYADTLAIHRVIKNRMK